MQKRCRGDRTRQLPTLVNEDYRTAGSDHRRGDLDQAGVAVDAGWFVRSSREELGDSPARQSAPQHIGRLRAQHAGKRLVLDRVRREEKAKPADLGDDTHKPAVRIDDQHFPGLFVRVDDDPGSFIGWGFGLDLRVPASQLPRLHDEQTPPACIAAE
jgi:hypothetical protein